MAPIPEVAEDAGRLQEGHGCVVCEHQVDAGRPELRLSQGVESPRQWRLQQGGMHVHPSTARAKELGQQGARGAGMCPAAILSRDEGTVEVPHEESGHLHVQGVCDRQHGVHKPGPLCR